MPLLRYNEKFGTAGNDNLTGLFNTITFGGLGNDILQAEPSETIILSGGAGSDTYNVTIGSVFSIFDGGNSIGDTLIIEGASLIAKAGSSPVYSALIDGKHFLLVEPNSQTQVTIFNWLENKHMIENIVLEDITLSSSQLSGIITSSEYFLGHFTWEESGTLPQGVSTADVNEAIAFYENRISEVQSAQGAGSASPAILGTASNDTLAGSDSADSIKGFDGNDLIQLGLGDDLFANGNAGNDTLYGGAGNEARILGGQGDDIVYGESGNDFLNGNKDSDSVYGGTGNDTVHGGQGDDLIYGEAGNDFLYGDLGNDTIEGSAGADTFIFGSNSGIDIITDFVTGTDVIQINSSIFATTTQAVAVFSSGVLDLGDGNTVTLTGVDSLSESDFVMG